MLLCLDEFERLEEVVGEKPETKQQLDQLMGLLRATIQHRRRVRLLVAGNSTFEELRPLWNDSFISARELRRARRGSPDPAAWPDRRSPRIVGDLRSSECGVGRPAHSAAREVAIGLLRQPIPVSEGFPDDAVPQEVAEAIVDRTGGQPYLTQLYGFWLVEELNKMPSDKTPLGLSQGLDGFCATPRVELTSSNAEAVEPLGQAQGRGGE